MGHLQMWRDVALSLIWNFMRFNVALFSEEIKKTNIIIKSIHFLPCLNLKCTAKN
jgi:hypothetical protein